MSIEERKDQLIIPFRIRLGVTGQRKLKDVENLSKTINQILKEDIFELYDKNSKKIINSSRYTPITFSILTTLAEGTERLVAREVLKFPYSIIEVVLPLLKEEYLQDFQSQESKEEFEKFLALSRSPIILRKKSIREEFSEIEFEEARRQAYKDAGMYIVNHCDLLIVLWDISKNDETTIGIVNYARKRKRPIIIISTKPPYEILVEKGYGLNAQSLSKIEMFNMFHISKSKELTYINNIYSRLFKNPEGDKLPEDTKVLIKNKLLPFYIKASLISRNNQRLYRFIGSSVYCFSTMAIVSVTLGTLIQSLSFYGFLLELIFLAIILFLVTFANKRETHKNWIESRFLAERIRSSIFFVICGIEPSSVEVPPYMRTAHHPDDWMIKIFYEILNSLPRMKRYHKVNWKQCSEFACKHWILNQLNFHRQRAFIFRKISKFLEWAGIIIFYSAIFTVLSHLLLFYIDKIFLDKELEKFLIFFAIVLPAAGAAVGGIRAHRGYSGLEKQSKHMEIALADLYERLLHINSPKMLELLLREADELMLREIQSWLMFMRLAELKPVP